MEIKNGINYKIIPINYKIIPIFLTMLKKIQKLKIKKNNILYF
jgi:hypothetical protein